MRSLPSRFISGLLFLLLLVATSSNVSLADVFTNVPEATAEGFQLVYTLPIEDQASYNLTGTVPYSVDNTNSISTPFDRIAYYLELDDGTGLQYAYASIDAFTSNINHIGLPTDSVGLSFQQLVSNMNVYSNASNVTNGTGIATGNIEFWPYNYGRTNSLGIPNASDGNYDFGDAGGLSGDYGSFQIHNYEANQTIFGYNQWGGARVEDDSDLGIGNAPSSNSDWTFAANAGDYTVKNLQILVRASELSVDSELSRAIFQRDNRNRADVPVTGTFISGISKVEARAIPRDGGSGTATDWQVIDSNPSGGAYGGNLTLDGGWYDIEVRSYDGSTLVAESQIERVGVGEVFVIAGQSNSANFGSRLLSAADDRVSAFDYNNWRHADDPMPIAGGTGGSPWPVLGDSIAAELDVPVGFISVGQGSTRVDQWLPGATNGPFEDPLYDRLKDALESLGPNGARAVLWHQGESDNGPNTSTTSYLSDLTSIISQSRIDAGYDIRWGIAQASYHPGSAEGIQQSVVDAQAIAGSFDPLNFVGALTDELIGSEWRRTDNLHFNEAGTIEHANRWFDALIENITFLQFAGDFNGDGVVDAADYTVWRDNLGATEDGSLLNGNGTGGVVDQDDYELWKDNFGASLDEAEGNSASVPEPSSVLLLLAGLALIAKRVN